MSEFKDIPGYEGLYKISEAGTVVSIGRNIPFTNRWGQPCTRKIKTKLLYPKLESNGYLRQTLSINNTHIQWSIHRLVAITYIPNPKNLPVINHKDGNKLNNTVENLEWCTILHNNHHAISLGLIPTVKSGKDDNQSKPVILHQGCKKIKYGSMGEAHKSIGLSRSSILRSITNDRELLTGKHKGLKFSFA